ncbi:MAG: serine hydrolase domain-containing protein [Planctomycetota bacterium]
MKTAARLLLSLALPMFAFAGDDTVVEGDAGKALDAAVQADPEKPFWGAVLVAKDGKVLLAKGYGEADYKKAPITPRTLFEIASASKMFTAIAILKLEMQGKLATTDPISKFFKGVPADKKAITVQHLVNHTSGISGEAILGYHSRETADEFVALAMKRPLASKIGETFEYSNPGYALLGVIIEKASGKKFEEYLRENLFKPAGMKDTGFCQDKSLDASRATVRRDSRDGNKDVGTAIEWGWSWGYRGMGGIVTTVYDLWRFDKAMRGDAILDAAAKTKHRTPALDNYGCGCLVGTSAGGQATISHSGSVAGFLCDYVRFPDDDAVVIVLSNDAGDPFGVVRRLSATIFRPPTATLAIDVKGRQLDEYGSLWFPGDAAWKAAKTGGGVSVSLGAKDGPPPLTATLSVESAAAFLKQLQGQIDAHAKAGAKEDDSLRAGVFTGDLKLKEGRGELKEAEIVIKPCYDARDADGKRWFDARMTLAFNDPVSGQQAFMAYLGLTSARQLAAALKGALAK